MFIITCALHTFSNNVDDNIRMRILAYERGERVSAVTHHQNIETLLHVIRSAWQQITSKKTLFMENLISSSVEFKKETAVQLGVC